MTARAGASAGRLGIALLVACGVLRSTDLFFRIAALSALSTFTLIAWEHLINAALTLPLAWRHRRQYRELTRFDLVCLLMIGWGASAGGILFFTAAFRLLNPALVILLQKLQPLVTIGLGVLLLGERPGPGFFGWAALGIVSSWFVSFGLTDPFTAEGLMVLRGSVYALLAAFFWGSGTAWGKHLLRRHPQDFCLANRFLLGAVFTVILAFATGNGLRGDVVVTGARPLLPDIAYMAIVPGLLATAAFYHGLARMPAAVTAILELTFPLASVVIMWGWFGRPLTLVQLIAGIVLCISMTRVSALPAGEEPEDGGHLEPRGRDSSSAPDAPIPGTLAPGGVGDVPVPGREAT